MQPTGYWMVRAGENNELAELVEDKGAVAVGWPKMGDLSDLTSRGEFRQRYKEAYPDQPGAAVGIKSAELLRFGHEILEGEYILTYLEASQEVLIGLSDGPYEYRTDLFGEDYPHVRRVRWLKRVSWEAFGAPAREAMSSALTVFGLDAHGTEIHRLATSPGEG
jgi:restriction system protein